MTRPAKRKPGLAAKMPAELKASFKQAQQMQKTNPAGAAKIFADLSDKAAAKNKNGMAARLQMRSGRAHAAAKDQQSAVRSIKRCVALAAKAKNREGMLKRLKKWHTRMKSKGMDQPAALFKQEVASAFGHDLGA